MSEPEDTTSTPEPVTDAETAPAPEGELDAPKKKKRKRKAEPEAEARIDDPRVRELEACFTVGDYARTRQIATELAASPEEALQQVGRDYLHRTGVDPIQIAFLAACLAALITIAWIYIPH